MSVPTVHDMKRHVQNLLTIMREEKTTGRFRYQSGSPYDIEIRAATRAVSDLIAATTDLQVQSDGVQTVSS